MADEPVSAPTGSGEDSPGPGGVPRIGRVLDGIGLLLFLAGGALYGRAWFGLRHLEAEPPPSDGMEFAAVGRVVELHELSRTGLLLMAGGAVVAVIAALVARRMRSAR